MKNNNLRLTILIALSITINLIGANIALFLKLPIYLDLIGTLLIAVLLGPSYAFLSALLSALLNWMTTDIFSLYFSPVAITVALLTGLLCHKNIKLKALPLKALIISIPGTIVASLITVILFHGITSSGSSIIANFMHGLGLDMTLSLVLVQLVTDYTDRLISLIIVIFIIKQSEPLLKNFKIN